MMPSTVFLSNRFDKLAEHLIAHLFQNKATPFEKRLVVVANAHIKIALQLYCAKHPLLGVAAGMNILTLPQVMTEYLSYTESPLCVLTEQELSFLLEWEIKKLQKKKESMDEEQLALFAPLFEYLEEGKESRILSLAEHLSRVFIRYGVYGGVFLKQWQQKKGWQQSLWRSIYSHPSKAYAAKAFTDESVFSPYSAYSLSIFGFHFLPKLFVNFFSHLGAHYFLFSPSAFFCEDLCTDRERLWLQKIAHKKNVSPEEVASLDAYLRDHHPFLANMGKANREFLKFTEDALVQDSYAEPEGTSVLHTLQTDLLQMRVSEYTQVVDDQSLIVTNHHSKLREVEWIYEKICSLIEQEKNSDSPLEPGDVRVFAPDIQPYVGLIHYVFGAKESRLDYAIRGVQNIYSSLVLQGLRHLLSMPSRRFSPASFLTLFSYSPFTEKWGWKEEDMTHIKGWVERSSIRWGIDGAQRQMFLPHVDESGSWEQGLDLMLEKLVLGENSEIDLSQAHLLGELAHLVASLKRDLQPFIDDVSLGLPQWIAHMRHLMETYFETQDERLWDDFEQMALHIGEGIFSAKSFLKRFNSIFCQTTGTFQSSHINAVQWSSIPTGGAPPARVICLMGMTESVFTGKELLTSLCEMRHDVEADYYPSRAEESRSLFLSILFSARDYLWITYPKYCGDEEQTPALVVQELVSYCHREITHILPEPFYARVSRTSFFSTPSGYFGIAPKTVDIRLLVKLARHPVQFYLNETLGIYLEKENKQQEEFAVSPLQLHRWCKESLKKPLEDVLHSAEMQGKLPQGVFKEAAVKHLEDQVEAFQEELAQFNIEPKDVFSVVFHPLCQKPRRLPDGNWVLPPLKIDEMTIVGKLEHLCSQGFVFRGSSKMKDLVKAWPQLLLTLSLPQFEQKPEPSLLCLETGEKKSFSSLLYEDALKKYLDYYKQSLNAPSPLMPEWAEAVIEADVDALDQAIAHAQGSFFSDAYLSWAFAKDPLPSAQALIDRWKSVLQGVFT